LEVFSGGCWDRTRGGWDNPKRVIPDDANIRGSSLTFVRGGGVSQDEFEEYMARFSD
jgi:hypothetical protein